MNIMKFLTLLLLFATCFLGLSSTLPQLFPFSELKCHEGYIFANGMCSPIAVTQQIQTQCTTSCCQTNCQPSCQPCAGQMPTWNNIPPIYIARPPQIPPQAPPQIPSVIPPQTPTWTPPETLKGTSPQTPPKTPAETPTETLPQTTPSPSGLWPQPWQPITTPTTIQTPCPNGTVSINGKCHLVYCGIGIYRDGKCIMTICPEGTTWNGKTCYIPETTNRTTTHLINSISITNNVDQSQLTYGLNTTNNIDIDISQPEVSHKEPSVTKVVLLRVPPSKVHVPIPSQPINMPIPMVNQPQYVSEPCCTVTTPNTCLWQDSYVCRSHSYQQCGPVCSQGNINLTPPMMQVRRPAISCVNSNCGYNQKPFYPDCSGCINADITYPTYCQLYCSHSVSASNCNSCQTQDLTSYCENYPSAQACRPEYGYVHMSSNAAEFK